MTVAKAHGRNAHKKIGRQIRRHAGSAEADGHDADLRARVAARDDLGPAEKRRLIATEHRPRITVAHLEMRHSFEKRVSDAARDLDRSAPAREPVISVVKRNIVRSLERSRDVSRRPYGERRDNVVHRDRQSLGAAQRPPARAAASILLNGSCRPRR